MKRKLVKQGAATMMISLPAKWVKENKLDKGDEINIDQKGNGLLIGLEERKVVREIAIDIKSFTESSIRTAIVSPYRLGYDKIKVNFEDKSVLKVIEDVVDNNLIGFEIIKKSDKECIIENITEPASGQFENIFSKVLMNIEELFLIVYNTLNGKKTEFEDAENKILQFDNFCRRVISKNNFEDNAQLKWAFHSQLFHGQRELYHLLRYLNKNKVKADKISFELLEKCKGIFQELKEAYIGSDLSMLEKIHSTEKDFVYKEGYKALEKANSIVVYHIIASGRAFYLASVPLIGLITGNKAP